MTCEMEYSYSAWQWWCNTHGIQGDHDGCLEDARERIAELSDSLDSTLNHILDQDNRIEDLELELRTLRLELLAADVQVKYLEGQMES